MYLFREGVSFLENLRKTVVERRGQRLSPPMLGKERQSQTVQLESKKEYIKKEYGKVLGRINRKKLQAFWV